VFFPVLLDMPVQLLVNHFYAFNERVEFSLDLPPRLFSVLPTRWSFFGYWKAPIRMPLF
jgi:hypothetical protein